MNKLFDFLALGGAVVGSLLVASNTAYSGYGYIFFLASSIASIQVISRSDISKAMLYQQIFFTGTNLFGIYRWLVM